MPELIIARWRNSLVLLGIALDKKSQEEFLYRAACAVAVQVVNKVLKKSSGCLSCRLAVNSKLGRML
jgi:hypothetical protein